MKTILTIVLFVSTIGCHAFTRRPVDVTVIDAEIEQPIEGAKVDAYYSLLHNDVYLRPWSLNVFWPLGLNIRKVQHQTTDLDGHAAISATERVALDATAPGYLIPTTVWGGHILPDNGTVEGRQATIRLYRGPVPIVTIVVPDGYRGQLLVEKRPVGHWLQGDVGQREFTFHSNEHGYVGIDATPLLMTIEPQLRIRYANGDGIPEWNGGLGDDGIAFRYVENCGTRMIYAVGDKSDEDRIPPLIHKYFPPNTQTIDRDAVERLFRAAANDRE